MRFYEFYRCFAPALIFLLNIYFIVYYLLFLFPLVFLLCYGQVFRSFDIC